MTIIKKMALLFFAAVTLITFFALRFDNSDRHYFSIDDLVVVHLVDKARNEQRWQPDWYTAIDPSQISPKLLAAGRDELARLDATHNHHYNFAAHISLSSAIAVTLDSLGFTPDSTRLLRSLAVLWDGLSLLLLSLLSYRLLGVRAALITAMCYCVLPLAVQSSHYARPDAILGLQAIGVIYLSYQLLTRVHKAHFIVHSTLIGALLAFAVATKASSLLYGIFPLTAFVYLLVSQQHRFTTLVLASFSLLISMLALVNIYFCLVDISWQDFIASTLSIQRYYQAPLPPDIRYDPSIWGHISHFSRYLTGSLGLLWLGCALIGTASLYQALRPAFWLIVLPAVIVTGYYLCQAVFFDRSLLVLMPVLCLLAATGVRQLSQFRYSNHDVFVLLLGLCLIWPAAHLSWTLQRHIGKTISDERKNYQQQLLQEMREQTQVNLWMKWVDRSDITHLRLPNLDNPQPRLYVVEHFNDPQSDRYLAMLADNNWEQVGYYQGDFAHLPTNSLHIAHEAAHFYYFIDTQALADFDTFPAQALSK